MSLTPLILTPLIPMLELNLENYSCVVYGNNGSGYMDLGLVNEQQLLTT